MREVLETYRRKSSRFDNPRSEELNGPNFFMPLASTQKSE